VLGDVVGCSAQYARTFCDGAQAVCAVDGGAEEEHDVEPFCGEVDFAI